MNDESAARFESRKETALKLYRFTDSSIKNIAYNVELDEHVVRNLVNKYKRTYKQELDDGKRIG